MPPGIPRGVPAGVTAGVAVFDRLTGQLTEELNPDLRFRSASVVKLLIVLDHLWDRPPGYDVSAADRARLDPMLRSSDDDAASYYWDLNGGGRIVDDMAQRLGLTRTARPPATHPGYWGYAAFTARDTIRIYQYLLDRAPRWVREYVMGNLHRATRCGTDGFDQSFGLAAVFDGAFGIKQGWSGFSDPGGSEAPAPEPVDGVDLVSEALHTTGTVGEDDRVIVAIYTLHPAGTPYGKACSDITRLTRTLAVPGGVRAPGSWHPTAGSEVRVRACPSHSAEVVATLPSGVDVLVSCQLRAGAAEGWAHLPKYGGYLSTAHLRSGGPKLPGVPDCT